MEFVSFQYAHDWRLAKDEGDMMICLAASSEASERIYNNLRSEVYLHAGLVYRKRHEGAPHPFPVRPIGRPEPLLDDSGHRVADDPGAAGWMVCGRHAFRPCPYVHGLSSLS